MGRSSDAGGAIWACIRLPGVRSREPGSERRGRRRSRSMTVPRRILVVEDETRILDFLARGLAADGMLVELGADGPGGGEARAASDATTSSSSISSCRS